MVVYKIMEFVNMKEIFFTPSGFAQGATYRAELLFNNSVVQTISVLVEDQQQMFTVTTPGTYVLKILSNIDSACVSSSSIQALFPVVTFTQSSVDCNNNTYTFAINLTNPSTSGSNVRYGYSNFNDCQTVGSWSSNPNVILSADSVTRYVFVRNDSQVCCNLIGSSVKEPCVSCTLTVTNIGFNCS